MTDTTNKTDEALASAQRYIKDMEDSLQQIADAIGFKMDGGKCADDLIAAVRHATKPQAEPAEDDVRELRKWLNEEPNRPIDRAALARVLAAQPQAEPVAYGCYCDLGPGEAPDGCVIDEGRPQDCVKSHRGGIKRKEDCPEWRPVVLAARPPVAQQGAAEAVKRWPFVETPGQFADRLGAAIEAFDGGLLPAVRNVLIENPPALAVTPVAVAAQPVAQGLTDDERNTIQGAINELPYAHPLIPRLTAMLSAHPAQAAEGDSK
jgi:hypothetical protein